MAEGIIINTESAESKPQTETSPLIFISHDSRDAELAEAFSTLLRNVSSGMLKSFRSSDKQGNEGIDFGDEWYKRLMERLDSASDVVCLFTERSVERPWILYEAGVAKGKLNKPVLGVALGVPLRTVSTGPFFQFQNCDDSAESLGKLLKQLASRISTLELIEDVVNAQVRVFKEKCEGILAALDETPDDPAEEPSDGAAATLFEEMKVMIRDLPSQVYERLSEGVDPLKRRRMRRFHPRMFEQLMFDGREVSDPIGILMVASFVREDVPWLYEIGVDAYRTIKNGSQRDIQRLIKTLQNVEDLLTDKSFRRYFVNNIETNIVTHEFPHMLRIAAELAVESKKSSKSDQKD